MSKRTIVIIGGGFAGVDLARLLGRQLSSEWQVILFSRENHLVFTPLMAEVVGASINPLHVVWPVRQIARRISCRSAAVTEIDLEQREVHFQDADGEDRTQCYEHVVLACGQSNDMGVIAGMGAHGWPFKAVGDALALRNHVIGQMERAQIAQDPEIARRCLTFAVVGGGFTGVELAGSITDLLADGLKYYDLVDPQAYKVTLLQGADRILPELPEELSAFALEKMRQRGIDVRLGVRAQAVTEQGVQLETDEIIEASTVICAVGTRTNPLIADLDLPFERGRLRTTPEMRVEGRKEVWALGDCAAIPNAHDGLISPPTAQFAVRQATQLARNLRRVLAGRPPIPFRYRALGLFASIGHHNAVGQVFGVRFSGFLAWLMWRGIYLSKMPTLARKIQIAFDWAWEVCFPRDIVQLTTRQTARIGRAHYEPGQLVFSKGDRGDRFYVIEHGRAAVLLAEGDEPVAYLGAGDHFGEGALLGSARRSASIRAEEPLDLVTVDQSSFTQLLSNLNVLRDRLEESAQRNRSATQFMRLARENPVLSEVAVETVMSHPIETFGTEFSLEQALGRARKSGGRGAYPVVDQDGKLSGICTRSDFYRAVRDLRSKQTPLRDIMTSPVATVKTSDTLAEAALSFVRLPIKRVVVVADEDSSKPVGMLTPFDMLNLMPIGG